MQIARASVDGNGWMKLGWQTSEVVFGEHAGGGRLGVRAGASSLCVCAVGGDTNKATPLRKCISPASCWAAVVCFQQQRSLAASRLRHLLPAVHCLLAPLLRWPTHVRVDDTYSDCCFTSCRVKPLRMILRRTCSDPAPSAAVEDRFSAPLRVFDVDHHYWFNCKCLEYGCWGGSMRMAAKWKHISARKV